jgi:hypothetical protein
MTDGQEFAKINYQALGSRHGRAVLSFTIADRNRTRLRLEIFGGGRQALTQQLSVFFEVE